MAFTYLVRNDVSIFEGYSDPCSRAFGGNNCGNTLCLETPSHNLSGTDPETTLLVSSLPPFDVLDSFGGGDFQAHLARPAEKIYHLFNRNVPYRETNCTAIQNANSRLA